MIKEIGKKDGTLEKADDIVTKLKTDIAAKFAAEAFDADVDNKTTVPSIELYDNIYTYTGATDKGADWIKK